MCDEYNGWANRETWALVLHIDNDQGWHNEIHEVVRDFYETANDVSDEQVVLFKLADLIKEKVEALLDPAQYRDEYGMEQPEELVGVLYDIGSIYRVNWDEAAKHYFESVKDAA